MRPETRIINYAKTRPVYDAYRSRDTAKSFWKPTGRRLLCTRRRKLPLTKPGCKKLPKVKALDAEFAELLTKKKAAYPEYRKARNEMQELVRAQKNVERFFAEEKPAQENEQAR